MSIVNNITNDIRKKYPKDMFDFRFTSVDNHLKFELLKSEPLVFNNEYFRDWYFSDWSEYEISYKRYSKSIIELRGDVISSFNKHKGGKESIEFLISNRLLFDKRFEQLQEIKKEYPEDFI